MDIKTKRSDSLERKSEKYALIFQNRKSRHRKNSPKSNSRRTPLSSRQNPTKDPSKSGLFHSKQGSTRGQPSKVQNESFQNSSNLEELRFQHKRARSDAQKQADNVFGISSSSRQKKLYGRKRPKNIESQKELKTKPVQDKRNSSAQARRVSRHNSNKAIQQATDNMETDKERLTALITSSFHTKGLPPSTTVDFYKFGKQLGKGAFGKVYLGLHRLTGLKVAIKTISKSVIKDQRTRRKVFQQVFVMKRVVHCNVVRLLQVFESTRHLMIVLQYAGGGDLLQLVKSRGKIPQSESKLIFKQVIQGVQACHQQNVIHRDIKLDNVLLTTQFSQAKLCDFGVSRMAKPGQKVNQQCGTPAYLAPQIIVGREYEPFFVDIWSMGVLLYAMVSGTVPFKAKSLQDLHKLILRCKYKFPEELSPEIQDLISRMLNPIPYMRISLDEMLEHQWFTSPDRESSFQDSANPRFTGGLSAFPFRPNEKLLLSKLEELGFPAQYVAQSLKFKDINHATATYQLLELHCNQGQMDIVISDKFPDKKFKQAPFLETQESEGGKVKKFNTKKMQESVKEYPDKTKMMLNNYRNAVDQLGLRGKITDVSESYGYIEKVQVLKLEVQLLKQRFVKQEDQRQNVERENEMLKRLVQERYDMVIENSVKKVCCGLFQRL